MPDPKQPVARRGLLVGAGGAGALAAAAALLPAEPAAPPDTSAKEREAGDKAAGYRLTEHIQRYYQTARI